MLRIDLKWPELRSKSEFRKSYMADRSEMARNAIEREFRTSKMADGSHFVKNCQNKLMLRIDLKWPEIAIESEFRTSKMADVSHFVKNFKTK